jgi:hypothetical protein
MISLLYALIAIIVSFSVLCFLVNRNINRTFKPEMWTPEQKQAVQTHIKAHGSITKPQMDKLFDSLCK